MEFWGEAVVKSKEIEFNADEWRVFHWYIFYRVMLAQSAVMRQ